jgi:hypothetical protein
MTKLQDARSMPIILELERLKYENREFKASLNYRAKETLPQRGRRGRRKKVEGRGEEEN